MQTAATVIPVLLVAGMINPQLLRDFSRNKWTSIYLRAQLAFTLIGTFLAVSFPIYFPETVDELSDTAYKVSYAIHLVVIGALSSTLVFVYTVAKFALEEDPHPDRLKNEKRQLENRLLILDRQIREKGEAETED